MAGNLSRRHSYDSGNGVSASRTFRSTSVQQPPDFEPMPPEGIDYVFDPPVTDNKYECPICLLVLSEPCQTNCGHRFCSACIRKWLREHKARCPIDNESLSENQLFPDNFAKREILALTVKCPNYKEGCKLVIEIRKIEEHKPICQYSLQSCPYHCNDEFILRKDLREHLKSRCQKRKVPCKYCLMSVIQDLLESHISDSCPNMPTKCNFCDTVIQRCQVDYHVQYICPNYTVECPYVKMGCKHKVERGKMELHQETYRNSHDILLCGTVNKIISILERMNGKSYQELVREHDQLEALLDLRADSGYVTTAQDTRLENLPSSFVQSGHPSLDVTHSGDLSIFRSTLSEPMTMLSHAAEQNGEFAKLKNIAKNREEQLKSKQIASMEINRKCNLLEERLSSANQKIFTLEQTVSEFESRNCNGTYMWPVKNYSRLRLEAETGDNTVIHSQGFYTSLYGYRVCIRLNLNGVDTALGTHVSLFVHLMKGDFDYMLDWPFEGRISLSILDQNDTCELRQNISETLQAKPHLAAFQRPVSTRNHKGFGYMEFAPIGLLENSSYIKNDILLVKAKVVVDE